MSDSFTSELLREMENALSQSEDDEVDDDAVIDVNFILIPGLRIGSEIMWVVNEEQLYYRNSFSEKTKIAAYTCRVSGCTARIYVNADGTAFRETNKKHLNSHGSQYSDFKYMYCDNKMKEKALSAPASMLPYDIYMEVVVE